MPEHEQEHEGTACQTSDTIELFDGHEHAVEHGERQTADEIVGDMAAQREAVDTAADGTDQPVSHEASDCQSHEEMLEGHEFLQVERQRGEEDGIAEGSDESGEDHSLEIQCRRDVEIHAGLVN